MSGTPLGRNPADVVQIGEVLDRSLHGMNTNVTSYMNIWKANGLVHIEGVIHHDGATAPAMQTDDQTIFTLPAGWRPATAISGYGALLQDSSAVATAIDEGTIKVSTAGVVATDGTDFATVAAGDSTHINMTFVHA